jgi:hypothetical protein
VLKRSKVNLKILNRNRQVVHHELEIILGKELLVDFVLLGAEKFRERICTTQHLKNSGRGSVPTASEKFQNRICTTQHLKNSGKNMYHAVSEREQSKNGSEFISTQLKI